MKRWFYTVMGLQLAFLVGEAAVKEAALSQGRIVLLKTAPVDPRSLFMGNYMALRYEISDIDLSQFPSYGSEADLVPGSIIYAGLVPEKPSARLAGVWLTLPPGGYPRLVWLQGRITSRGPGTIRVEYGLERYYIPETKGEEVNKLGWRRGKATEIVVEVAVSENGKGLIRRVLVDGRPLGF